MPSLSGSNSNIELVCFAISASGTFTPIHNHAPILYPQTRTIRASFYSRGTAARLREARSGGTVASIPARHTDGGAPSVGRDSGGTERPLGKCTLFKVRTHAILEEFFLVGMLPLSLKEITAIPDVQKYTAENRLQRAKVFFRQKVQAAILFT